MPTPRIAHRAVRLRLAALALAVVIAAAACGSSSPAPDVPAAAVGGGTVGDLPAISVVEVTSGASVLLTDLATDARPTLLWMWAPH